MLELDRLPEHLLVIGGGYVGLEFAQAYRRFGSRVTILHRGPHLLAEQDDDVKREALAMMTDAGIEVVLSAEITSVSGMSSKRVTVKALTSWMRTHHSQARSRAKDIQVQLNDVRRQQEKLLNIHLSGAVMNRPLQRRTWSCVTAWRN